MFKDVPAGHYAYKTIERLSRMKAISGKSDGTFGLGEPVKREDCAAFVDKALHYEYELIRGLLPTVVKVTAKLSDGRTSLGSGVVLDRQGHIATNCHVILDGIDPAQEITVYLDSIPTAGLKAKVLYGDLGKDVAVLKIQADPALLQPVEFPDEPLRIADKLFCIGNPLGYVDTVSAGIISCPTRDINGNAWIQTDAAINPGNSGGGAFTVRGQFAGLPTFIIVWADETKTIPVSNIGFISPYYNVQTVYQKALAGNVAFHGELTREIVFTQLFV